MNNPITTTPQDIVNMLLAFCGALITISAAVTVVIKVIDKFKAPDRSRDEKIETLEREVKEIQGRLEEGDNRFNDDFKRMDDLEQRMIENVQSERDKIYDRYDAKLSAVENIIETNHKNTEDSLAQIKEELSLLTDCISAVLNELKQQGVNGKVTDTSENLQEFMRKKAHE